MRKNILEQKIFTHFSFMVILLIIFIFLLLITKIIVEGGNKNVSLKFSGNLIKNVLTKEIIKPKSRFTSFFVSENINILNNIGEYKKAYYSFSEDKKILVSGIINNFSYINRIFENKKELPVFFDDISKYTFIPLKPIKVKSLQELGNNFESIFYHEVKKSIKPFLNNKVVNYIYIDVNSDNIFLILLSCPYDPDPLFPNNRRMAMVTGYKTDSQSMKDLKLIDSFSISNKY